MIENLLAMVDKSILNRSGSVFYSGRSAFARPSDIYLLGLNPGGDPIRQADETIQKNISDALARPANDWSAYADESWNGRPAGSWKMQPRVLHMMRSLGLDPRHVPASNVVFVRSARESDLEGEKRSLLSACWPVHQAPIEGLGVKAVLCLGGTAGKWVREALDAHHLVDSFSEANGRRWTSQAHRNSQGRYVLTLTHPSIAAWNVPSTDPTPLVARVLTKSGYGEVG